MAKTIILSLSLPIHIYGISRKILLRCLKIVGLKMQTICLIKPEDSHFWREIMMIQLFIMLSFSRSFSSQTLGA